MTIFPVDNGKFERLEKFTWRILWSVGMLLVGCWTSTLPLIITQVDVCCLILKINNWWQTWYLLVELNGISATFLFLSLILLTEPQDSSIHLSKADSEASPATSLFRMGKVSCPALNWALLHSAATRARDTHVTELLSNEAPAKRDQLRLWKEELVS